MIYYKAANIPRNDEKFQAKYTLTTDGQKKYGGWKKETYDKYNDLMDWVKEWRKDDEDNDKAFQKYALNITREDLGITADEYQKGRRNKRKAVLVPEEPQKARAKFMDEDSDSDSGDETDDGNGGSVESTAV